MDLSAQLVPDVLPILSCYGLIAGATSLRLRNRRGSLGGFGARSIHRSLFSRNRVEHLDSTQLYRFRESVRELRKHGEFLERGDRVETARLNTQLLLLVADFLYNLLQLGLQLIDEAICLVFEILDALKGVAHGTIDQ